MRNPLRIRLGARLGILAGMVSVIALVVFVVTGNAGSREAVGMKFDPAEVCANQPAFREAYQEAQRHLLPGDRIHLLGDSCRTGARRAARLREDSLRSANRRSVAREARGGNLRVRFGFAGLGTPRRDTPATACPKDSACRAEGAVMRGF